MKSLSPCCRGFSLIELMVTVALVAILLMVAAPSFTTFQRNAELTSRANSLLAVINAARGEAMKRGRDAVILPLDGSNWSSGVLAFVDFNSNRTYDVATDVLIYRNDDPLPSYLTITANGQPNASPPYMRFDAQGYSKPAGTDLRTFSFSFARNDVSGSDLMKQTRRLRVAITGRPQICTPTSTSDAACLVTGG
jgi:type IV fimbrial biogenesis protein FimT